MINYIKNYSLIILLSVLAPSIVQAHMIYISEEGCDAVKTAQGLANGAVFDKACAVNKVVLWGLFNLCDKVNPFPTAEDYLKKCYDDPLTPIEHKHPKPPGGSGKVFGEPHLITRDGLSYGFQAQGDYALIVSEALEVQARFKYGRGISILRGVAIKKDEKMVVIETTSKPSEVIINGVPAMLKSGDWYTLGTPKDYVQRVGDSIIIQFKGEVSLVVKGTVLTVKLDEKYAGKTQGLHGDGDGNPINDLRTSNGDPVDATDPKSLYGQYMMDWRRVGKASFFPTPFNYIGNPNAIAQELIKLSDIDPTKRQEAFEKCLAAGLKAGAGLDECTYDLAVTGDDSFMNDTLEVAKRLMNSISAVALTTKDVSIFLLDNTASVSRGIPGDGAGELERSTNLDRYTFTVPETEEQFILIKDPCASNSTMKALIRQNGTNISEYSPKCNEPLKLPKGKVEIDIFSSVGDTFNYDFDIVDSSSIVVKREPNVSIDALKEVAAGTEVEVSWKAPKELDGFINIQSADEKPSYAAKPYIYTKKKSSEYLRMPSTAGDYVLRWYNRNNKKVLAERAITLMDVDVSITAPDEVTAGTEIEITWQAPKGLDSFINIQSAGEKPSYAAKPYIYTKKKSSEYLRMPSMAGDYVLRWYNRNDKKMLAERAITLMDVGVSITAFDEVTAGTEIEITWQAPKGLDSFINIQSAGEKPSYAAKPYIYTKKKSSEYLRMPSTAGDYVLRWYNRNDKKMLAERAISLMDADISIIAPDEAIAGSDIEISWQAPKGLDSFINIQPADKKPSYGAKPYIYTKKKSSENMKMPEVAGEYIFRWFNRNDRKMLTERNIKLLPKEKK